MTKIFCNNHRIGKFQTFYGTKLCDVDGCFDKAGKISGLCKKHYRELVLKIKPRFYATNLCTFKDCIIKVYAKSLCKKHYQIYLTKGEVKYCSSYGRICIAENCNEEALPKSEYCKLHHRRIKDGTPLNFPKGSGIKGERNPRWNGGTSYYPNHCQMKKIRKEVLEEANYICYFCGGHADRIHHIDKSKDNHSKENLRASCAKCNIKLAKPYTSKFKRLYGYTIKELVDMKLFKNYKQIPAW